MATPNGPTGARNEYSRPGRYRFRGETLRGLLLNAYAFWEMGRIMLIGAIVAFAAAAVMLIMSVFGVAHLRRVPAEAEIFGGRTAPAHQPTPAV